MKFSTLCIIVGSLFLSAAGCGAKAAEPVSETPEPKIELELTAAPSPQPQTQPKTQQTPAISRPGSALGPRIVFKETTHDFGQVPPGGIHSCRFEFKNAGDQRLTILRTKSTCGCTVPNLSKKTYAPGESGHVSVRYHVSTRPGSSRKNVYVNTNDPNNRRMKLTVQATVVQKVAYEPMRIKFLAKGEQIECPEITLKSTDNKPFSVKGFSASGGAITADVGPTSSTSFTIKPKVDAEKLAATPNGKIDIRLTHPDCEKVSIPFQSVQRFTLRPSFVTIRDAEPGVPKQRRFEIINNFGENFEVESITSAGGMVKVLDQRFLRQRYIISFELTPSPPTGDAKFFREEIFVNIKGGERLKVICQGNYAGQAGVSRTGPAGK